MTDWRMRLHPRDPALAAQSAYRSLAAGFMGLDFSTDAGDLRRTQQSQLPHGQRDGCAVAHAMATDARVLSIAPPFPLALALVGGDDNSMRRPEPEVGVSVDRLLPA